MNSKNNINTLGELIIKLRKEKGYSQRKFAQLSGLSNTTISRIENGETLHPDIETIKLLAAHLDIDEANLLSINDISQEPPSVKKHAKLKFLQQPVKEIQKYSSVSTQIIEAEEDPLPELIPPHQFPAVTYQEIEPEPEVKPIQLVTLKGMRLITLRLEKNITQKELADALNLDKTLISQYEGEIIKPDYETVQKLADFFGVAIEYLVGNVTQEAEVIEPKRDMFSPRNERNTQSYGEIRPEYIEIAKEIQNAGIEIKDVRTFIEMIRKYKGY